MGQSGDHRGHTDGTSEEQGKIKQILNSFALKSLKENGLEVQFCGAVLLLEAPVVYSFTSRWHHVANNHDDIPALCPPLEG